MTRLFLHCIRATLILITFTAIALAKADLPEPQGLVNDFANKLSQSTKQSLDTSLRSFRARSGIEFTIVLIPFADLRGRSIDDYALQIGRKWGVGSGPEKLGLVLVVAIKPPDRKGVYQGMTRLEVSRRLESDITNSTAGELIGKMKNDLKAGRFDQAITTGTNSIISTLTIKRNISNSPSSISHPPISSAQSTIPGGASSDWGGAFMTVFFFGLLIVAIIALINRGGVNRNARGAYSRYNDHRNSHSSFWFNSYHNNTTTGTSSNNIGGSDFFGGSSDNSGSSGTSDFGSSSSSGDFGSSSSGGDFGGGGATDSW